MVSERFNTVVSVLHNDSLCLQIVSEFWLQDGDVFSGSVKNRISQMDWHIKTIARTSTVSGESFAPGDRVDCIIFKDEEAGELGRADLQPEELASFKLPGEVLGRWSRIVKDPDDEAASARETMASAEDFFFSLYENEKPEAKEESDMLKHLLALMLERKRVLRPTGPRQVEGVQTYVHVKAKREVIVPIAEISTELMLKIEDTIGDIIL
jgi:hypothetical protein